VTGQQEGEVMETDKNKSTPPRLFLRFFRWFCHPKLLGHIEGDLMELYNERLREHGKRKSRQKICNGCAPALQAGNHQAGRRT
jgi:hypothetical protein